MSAEITIYRNEKIKKLGDLYGLFFEDINHAADGGLYAEMIQNRSFEFDPVDRKDYHSLTAWEKVEENSSKIILQVNEEHPLNPMNRHYLSMHVEKSGLAGIRNLGFNQGIVIRKDAEYSFSLFARTEGISSTGTLIIRLEDDMHTIFAERVLTIDGTEWRKYHTELNSNSDCSEARLVLLWKEEGEYAIDMVSLFPKDTYKGRENGLRKDIATLLADMKPKFMRFPGGCLVHDGTLCDTDRTSVYRWKRTLGSIEERVTWRSNWNYNQTLGLGYYEYFCFCEDIGAEPLPVLPGGFNPHKEYAVPLDQLQPWVDDALDLIEFANGDVTTKWGAKRAELGHKEPFGLKYIGIGNEEIGEAFYERYPYFHKAIREKYPEIKIINTSGPFVSGEGYETGWKSARKYGSDLVDEHYYQSPEWFLANMHHYDDYDSAGPKVFLGEYASWGNTYYNALVEAAYMTHLEKAPAVELACYAPMLCNVDYVNWKPDMIWFNQKQVYGTPNYYVQKLFMNHQGNDLLRTERKDMDETVSLMDNKPITGKVILAGNDITGTAWDIVITNPDTGEQKSYDEIQIQEDNKRNFIDTIEWNHYIIEMKFIRHTGRKGMNLYFGETDEKNSARWEFGGWDNFDSIITTTINGRNSCISHRIFKVETEKEYQICLEIENRKIRAYTNGELYNETEFRLPELEELYITSSYEEESGDTILKAVNLMGEDKKAGIKIEGLKDELKKVHVYEMAGFPLDAENSFDHPTAVAPKEREFEVHGTSFDYVFPGHSVTVLRIMN